MDRLTYPNVKANLDLCFKQLHEICGGDRNLAIMSIPPQQTDFDMQFHSAFDELQAYRDTGLMPDEISHWIPAKDWMPNKSGTFIICTSCGDVFVAEYWHEREEFTRRDGTKFCNPVVYWQELPQPPKGEKS